jgi:hypothetical protein
LKLRWLRWLDVGNGEVNKHETMKVIICQTLNRYITWGVTKSLSLRIYPPHKRISSQDTTCSSLIWITSEVTEQLESISKIAGDVTQESQYFWEERKPILFIVLGEECFFLLLIKGFTPICFRKKIFFFQASKKNSLSCKNKALIIAIQLCTLERKYNCLWLSKQVNVLK